MNRPFKLFTPWRTTTFAIGLAALIYGALTLDISDWDVGVSVVMAFLTFLTAEQFVDTFARRDWPAVPLAIFWSWFSVDGSYVVYHVTVGNQMLRAAQWPTSLCLYLLCGFIWRAGNLYFGRTK